MSTTSGRHDAAQPYPQAKSFTLELIAAMHVRPGDLFAGLYVPDAPTRPVQPFAAAHLIAGVKPFRDDKGVKWLRFTRQGEVPGPWGGLMPVRPADQVFVIRTRP